MAIHYVCNSCNKRIFPVSARFHCLVCRDHDTCQACHLAARFAPPHEGAHPFHVVYGPTASPPPPPPPPPPIPFRSPPQPPPLPPRQPSSTTTTTTTATTSTTSPHAPHTPTWGPLLGPQHTPTPHLLRLADAAFTHFSTATPAPATPRTLTPEQLTAFYTAMGRSGSTNFPALFHTLMARYGCGRDPSDAQIAFVFAQYGYAFVPGTRAGSAVRGGMPLLLLEGFRSMLVDEILEAPGNAWEGFNTLLAGTPLAGVGGGPVPRGCFPEREDAAARARGDRISAVLVERSRVMFDELEKRRAGGGGGGGVGGREGGGGGGEEGDVGCGDGAGRDRKDGPGGVRGRVADG